LILLNKKWNNLDFCRYIIHSHHLDKQANRLKPKNNI